MERTLSDDIRVAVWVIAGITLANLVTGTWDGDDIPRMLLFTAIGAVVSLVALNLVRRMRRRNHVENARS